MSVNMFEGARRIMKLGMIIIALIGIYAAFDASSDIKADEFTLMDNAQQPVQNSTQSLGPELDYDPFAPAPSEQRLRTVDYDPFAAPAQQQPQPAEQPQEEQETGKPWEKYKTTATEQPKPVQPIDHYEQQAANDEQFVNKQYWPKKAKAILMPLGITALSIYGFWIFCWIIGWVVRGFTGISMGQDRKN